MCRKKKNGKKLRNFLASFLYYSLLFSLVEITENEKHTMKSKQNRRSKRLRQDVINGHYSSSFAHLAIVSFCISFFYRCPEWKVTHRFEKLWHLNVISVITTHSTRKNFICFDFFLNSDWQIHSFWSAGNILIYWSFKFTFLCLFFLLDIFISNFSICSAENKSKSSHFLVIVQPRNEAMARMKQNISGLFFTVSSSLLFSQSRLHLMLSFICFKLNRMKSENNRRKTSKTTTLTNSFY